MKLSIPKTGLLLLALLLLALSGCSGSNPDGGQAGVVPVKPVPTTRILSAQIALLVNATGIAASNQSVQTVLSKRANSLPTIGGSISGNTIQGSMDLTAAFCMAAVNNVSKKPPLPQTLFPTTTDFLTAIGSGTAAKYWPVDRVLTPLAQQLLRSFSGKIPPDSEVSQFVSIIQGYLNQQTAENQTGGAGARAAMVASCVTAGALIGGTVSP